MHKFLPLLSVACATGLVLADGGITVANPGGILEASSIEDLQSSIEAAGADGLTLGSGMLKWTGTGETVWPGGYTAAPVSNLTVTVNVTDPDATLVIDGAVSEATPAFFTKSGPGTVEFRKGGRLGFGLNSSLPWGANTFWNTYAAMTEAIWAPMTPTWNERGEVKGGTTTFTIVEGAVRLNAPGETFSLGNMPWIGDRQLTSTYLEITNRTTVGPISGWFSLARGTGGNNASCAVRVVDGSALNIGGICLGNANGMPGYYAHSRLEVEKNSQVNVTGEIFQPEHGGEAIISVKDHSFLNHSRGPSSNTGWKMNSAAKTVIDGGSTALTHAVSFYGDAASLSVTDKSVLQVNREIPDRRNAVTLQNNAVRFDDSTLMPRSRVLCDWFGNKGVGYANFTVGAKGMTLHNDTTAYFGTVPKAESATSKIVKTGTGTLHVRAPKEVPVEALEGRLAFDATRLFTNGCDHVVSPAADTRLGVFGEGALAGMTVAPAEGAAIDFVGRGWAMRDWACNGYAHCYDDGTVQLTIGETDCAGSAWRIDRVPIDRSFTVSFDSYAHTPDGKVANGVMLAFQNKDTLRLGGSASNQGYNYGAEGKRFEDEGVNSFAMGVSLSEPNFLLGIGGNGIKQYITGWRIFDLTGLQLAASETAPCRCTFRYDATAHKAKFSVFVPATKQTVTKEYDIDLAKHIGAATAFVGFVAGSSAGTTCEHCVANYRYVPDGAPADSRVVRTGGNLALAAGQTLSATLSGNDATSVFALDSLKADGAVTLDVADAGSFSEEVVPPISSADSNLWTFAANGHWTEQGPACAKHADSANGGIRTKYAYPVTGSWKISFDYLTGWAGTHADWLRLNIGNATAVTDNIDSTGLGYMIQFYDNSASDKDCFWIWAHKAGVAQVVEGDATKIDFTGQFSLHKYQSIHFDIEYDDAAKTLTTTLSQNQNGSVVTKSFTMKDFKILDVFGGQERARFWMWQRVGGLQSEAIAANFSWTGERMAAATAMSGATRPALAFDRFAGVTAITKTGSGDLAFLKPESLNASVTLAEGGLRLAKEPLETVTVGAGGGWIFSGDTGVYTETRGVKIGSGVSNNKDAAQLRHRVRVSADWRAHWKMWNLNGADAISFFLHNDPRGNNLCGSDHTGAGFTGIGNGRVVSWYTYAGNSSQNKMGTGTGPAFNDNVSPVDIRGATSKDTAIDTTIEYDSTAHTLKVTLVQGANTFTKTYTGCDIQANVGGDYAYLGVGTGGGGVHTYPYYDEFTFEQIDKTDAFAATKYLSSVDVTAGTGCLTLDTSLENGTFNVADTVTVAAGKTLRALAANASATLKTATLSLGAGAKVAGDANVTVAPDAIVGDAAELNVDGVTLDIPAADIAAGKFAKTTLRISNGAKVRFLGPGATLKDVYVDGVRQPKRMYSAADWIAEDSPYGVNTMHGMAILLR